MTRGPLGQTTADAAEGRGRHVARWLLAAGIVGALMAAVAQRQAIVGTVPASARVFALLGLPVNLRGLAFRDVKGTLLEDGAQHVLAVVGEIDNVHGAPWPVPDLRIALRGSDGRDIYAWTAAAPKSKLETGETVAFRARLAEPPEGAREIVVQFADAAALTTAREKGRR